MKKLFDYKFRFYTSKNEWNLPTLSLPLFFLIFLQSCWVLNNTMWKRWLILNDFYFQAVSSLSFYNGVVHVVINAVILGFCILHIGTWGWTKVSFGIDILSFPIALGVIVFRFLQHPIFCLHFGQVWGTAEFFDECMTLNFGPNWWLFYKYLRKKPKKR